MESRVVFKFVYRGTHITIIAPDYGNAQNTALCVCDALERVSYN